MEGGKKDWKMDLAPLLNPRSVAFVGISGGPKPGMGGGCVKNLQKFGYGGEIFPINPKYDEIMGFKCYKSLLEIPREVDLLVIAIPAEGVLDLMREAVAKGIKAAVIYSGGFAETGAKGKELQDELVRICEENQIRLCGPNNLGVLSFQERAMVYANYIPPDMKVGGFGYVGQSGSIMMCALAAAYARGIGCSYLISSGNEAVLEGADFIRFMLEDPHTRVIGCFIEGFKNPEKFIAVADMAWQQEKPIVVLKVGRSPKGQEAALGHTGSMTGSDAVQDAFFRKKGILRVDTVEELVETADLMLKAKLPKRNRLAFTMISGGGCGIVADLSHQLGLQIPDLSEATRKALAPVVPAFGHIANPLDLTGVAFRNPDMYFQCLEILLQEDVDIIGIDPDIPWIDPLIPKAQELAAKSDKLLAILCLTSENMTEEKSRIWRQSTIPILQDPKRGLKAIALLLDYSSFLEKRKMDGPEPAWNGVDLPKVQEILERGGKVLTEYRSKQLLNLYGIPITREALARNPAEAARLAREIGYPVALKIQSEQIAHKTEAGGIRLNVQNDAEVQMAFTELLLSARGYAPAAEMDGVLVQEMAGRGTEAMAGVLVDPQFGPCLVFGLGGIYVEILKDISMRLAPLNRREAREMVEELRSSRIFQGFRGQPPADREGIVDVLIRLGRLALDLKDCLREIDLNPLLVYGEGKGVKVVDALVRLK